MSIAELPESKTIVEKEPFNMQPITYPVTLAKIAELVSRASELTISGLDDKAGYKLVHDTRIEARDTRLAVENRRKELKRSALDYGAMVDSVAESLKSPLVKLEDNLAKKEGAIDAEKERLKQVEIARKQAILQGRVEMASALGANPNVAWLTTASDGDFSAFMARSKTEYEARQAAETERLRIQAEADEQRAKEAAALAAERAKLNEIAAKQKAEADRLEAEKKAVEDEKEKQRRTAELEQTRKDASEKARVETEARLKREAEAKDERNRREAAAQIERERAADKRRREIEEAEAAELARIEAEKPHKEKMIDFVAKLRDLSLLVPDGPWSGSARDHVESAAREIEEIIGARETAEKF